MENNTNDNNNNNNDKHRNIDFNLIIRQMNYDEIPLAAELFSRFGLYDSVGILQAYYESDPEGFFAAIDQDRMKLIGSCAAPMTTHQTSFIGLYVVDPEYQSLGIGVKLFNRCLEKVGDGNCGLSAVPSKFKVYKDRAGFKVVEGRSLVIYEGSPYKVNTLKCAKHLPSNYRLVRLTSVEYDESLVKKIIEFDQTVHLDNRSKLLQKMFAQPGTITIAIIDDNEDKVVGYGCIQLDIINRSQPGPLYAINDNMAEILFSELIRSSSIHYENNRIGLYSIDNCHYLDHLSKNQLGLIEGDRCEKLYTKFIPPFNYNRLYCWHTPDFSC